MKNKIQIATLILMPLVLIAEIKMYAQSATKPETAAKQIMMQKRYIYEGRLKDEDSNRIETFRLAALRNDRSLLPSMIQAIGNPSHKGYTYSTIHALAQLGATDALPVIEEYVQDRTDADLSNFSKVSKARLVAKSVSETAFKSKQSTNKILRFYKELGMTPIEMNADLAAYQISLNPNFKNAQGEGNRFSIVADAVPPPHPVGVYAVRDLADMVYHGDYNTCISLPEVAQIDFTRDYPSALKMRLAALPSEQRLSVMLQELSHKKNLNHWDNYEIQLASNEGLTASNAAAALLKIMETTPNQYSDVGFTALVRVIWGTGDSTKVDLVKHLLVSRLIYSANLPIADLTNSVKRGREPAY